MFELVQSRAFEDWLAKLRDRQARVIVAARLARLAAGQAGDAKSLSEGVRELRIHVGPGYRIYYQVRGSRIILLLCGGDKSTQSTDIARARAIARTWED